MLSNMRCEIGIWHLAPENAQARSLFGSLGPQGISVEVDETAQARLAQAPRRGARRLAAATTHRIELPVLG